MRLTREIRTADQTGAFEHRRDIPTFNKAGVAKKIKVGANRWERRETRRNLRSLAQGQRSGEDF